MKNIKLLLVAFLGVFLFAACEDEMKPVLDFEKGTPTSLVSPIENQEFTLLAADAAELIVFEFEKSEFNQAVANEYQVEISTSGTPFVAEKVFAGNFDSEAGTISVSVLDLNKALLLLEYVPAESAALYVRINNRILDSNLSLYSEVVKIMVAPYEIKSDGTTDDGTRIYMIGGAVPSGWSAGDAIEMINVGPDTYRTTTTFTQDRFRFFGQADWGPDSWNFPYFTSVPTDYFENALQPDREDGDENFWFIGEPGDYVITVNIATKVITIAPAPSDGTVDDGSRIYIVGAGVPDAGWSPGDAIEMINIAPNVYRATATFANDRFRFLGQMDWNPVAYNWPFFTGYVSGMLESALQPDREDGDGNIWFKGVPGSYVITVDLDKKTIVMDAPFSDDGTKLYIVGAGVPDAGWSPGDAIEMNNIAPNVYRATATFANDRFRFLGQKDWNPVSYNWPYFTGEVSSMLESALQPDREDGDGNVWFKGTPGSFTITVDLAAKDIIMY